MSDVGTVKGAEEMSIEEEIKILENALSGALLVPSECAFVSIEIIKICLETLRTYESWELLIRHEIEKQIRADTIEEIEDAIFNSFDDVDNTVTVISVLHHIHELLRDLKEKKDE